MTISYVIVKVKEALEVTGNDKRDAQKLLVTWAVRDQQLLLGFAKPHLKGLVASQVEDVLSKGKKKSADAVLSKKDMDAIVKGHATKNEKRKPSKVPPPKSSAHQATMMHKLAAAFKKK